MATPMIASAAIGQTLPGSGPAANSAPGGKDTFLKLLVAQIKNQNPLNPADGMEFVTQLAQFSELEQIIGMREELSQLRRELTQPPQAADGA